MPELTPADLRRIVLEQSQREVGIPVLLFTTATLDVGSGGVDAVAPISPETVAATTRVTDLAGPLGLDLDDLSLFSPEAYLLQTALGDAGPVPA